MRRNRVPGTSDKAEQNLNHEITVSTIDQWDVILHNFIYNLDWVYYEMLSIILENYSS